jgi:hypothetical protein
MAIDPRPGFGALLKLARGGIGKNLAEALGHLDGAVAVRRTATD